MILLNFIYKFEKKLGVAELEAMDGISEASKRNTWMYCVSMDATWM